MIKLYLNAGIDSPVVDEKFLAALNKVTDAEVFVPIEKEGDPRKFAGLDVSRNCFGKVYKELLKPYYNQ